MLNGLKSFFCIYFSRKERKMQYYWLFWQFTKLKNDVKILTNYGIVGELRADKNLTLKGWGLL